MTSSTLLSLNFNDQSIVDNTGQWEVLNDGSDVLKFALVGGSANYSLVVDHFAYKSPAVLGIIDSTDSANEYTIDFDMYVQRTFGTCSWVMGFKNASATDATILIYLTEGEQVSGSIYKYNVCFQRRTNSYVSSWDDYAQTSDKPVRSGEWTKIRIKALKNTGTGYYEFEIYVNGVLKASNTTTYPITTTLENRLTIGGPSGTAYLLCDASVTPEQCSSDTGCALDNLIITRGEAPLRQSVVSLAGLQRNNANLLSYVHSKLATVATTGSKPALESLSTNSIPFHNSYPRCKYLGTTITDAQNTAIKNRTYDDLFIGDYWTINGINWRIVAIDYYYNVGDTNFDKGNVIVMPDTVLYNAQMNTTDTTAGAYAGSLMRTQNLNNARTIAQNTFGSRLANHRILLANSVDNSGPNSWAWYDGDGVELPNEVQIYGTRAWGSALKGWDVATQKQQFPLMLFAPQFVNIRQDYWLQDVSSFSVSSGFACVAYSGFAGFYAASASHGVRPSVTLSYV